MKGRAIIGASITVSVKVGDEWKDVKKLGGSSDWNGSASIDLSKYVSPRQLDRIIIKGFGMSFYQYLTNLRMNMAIRLLKQTEDTITDIAEKSGFSSYQHLYRVLKRNGCDMSRLRDIGNQAAVLGADRDDEK